MRLKIPNRDIQALLDAPEPAEYPKYATQIINLANQNAQGTRPKIVGQQTELIQQFPGKTLGEWEQWYQEQYPNAIETATDKIFAMVQLLQNAAVQIDRTMVESWVRDLILVKTFVGLRFQEAILRRVAESVNLSYRLALPAEESLGIDGYIGERAVSIKPITYRGMQTLPEQISAAMIFYEKHKDGIVIEFDLPE